MPGRPETMVFVQTDAEILVARGITKLIRKYWTPPQHFRHLSKGGHVSALRRHKHDRYFAAFDIEHFFGAVTRNKVKRALLHLGMEFAEVENIAHRSCVRTGEVRHVPFGYLQSPALASLVLDKSALGQELRRLARSNQTFVTVFMDDIVLSHPNSAETLAEACARVEAAAEVARFKLSASKTQLPGQELSVFNIRLEHEMLAIEPDRYEVFARTVLHHGPGPSTDGILGYVASVNDEQLSKLSELV
jgi:hypothetical protein